MRPRRGALPATAVVLVLAATGCGDNKPTAHSAPLKGAPALLPLPNSASNGDTANPTTDTTSTSSTDSSGTSTTSTTPGGTGASSGGSAGTGSGGGTGGSQSFCAQNPGAC